MLDEAFADVRAPTVDLEANVLDCAYLATMRYHISDMTEDEYHYTLPWLLKDIVIHHPGNPVDNLGADEVIWSLQPWGSDPTSLTLDMRRLGLFSPPQALAIISWLDGARALEGYSLSEDEIDSAVAFWQDFLERQRVAANTQHHPNCSRVFRSEGGLADKGEASNSRAITAVARCLAARRIGANWKLDDGNRRLIACKRPPSSIIQPPPSR
jgi:hypothetical protein